VGLAVGSRLGPYEILAALGAGGMGEVYRARDTRLDRIVAIKILADALASDATFRERFAREARAISQIDHPHICTLYDVGEHDGTAFLVMQFIEGDTLAARLSTGSLPLSHTLRYASEIAGALDRAHRSGIVHRDLKPANIMLTRSGAKLLDFGLAKSAAPIAGVTGLSMLPTTPPGLTGRGTILGTLQYMAPEQLEGREADARTDIFAFGAVLYEMVTGRKAFEGRSPASLIGAILKDVPPPIAVNQPLAPAALDRVVKTCLAKDPDERWQSAGDLQRELRWIAEGSADSPAPGTRARSRSVSRARLAWIVGSIMLAAVVGAITFALARTHPQPPAAIRFEILPPPGTNFGIGPANPHHAISPDGRRVAFTLIESSGRGAIALRDLSALDARILPGTDGIRLGNGTETTPGNGLPFWSPDNRYIGFFANGALKKIAVSGGPVQTLCSTVGGEGGTWNEEGTIVFAPSGSSGLFRVSAAGGTPTPVTILDELKKERSHRHPWFLPDGRHFLYVAIPSTTLYVGSLDSRQRQELFTVESKAIYAEGHLLFTRNGFLLAQPFDAAVLRVTGEAFPIAEDVGVNRESARAALSASSNGVVTYRRLGTTISQLMWVDRAGKAGEVVGERATLRGMHLSPDGTHVAVVLTDPATNARDLWTYDVAGGRKTRLTSDAADEATAVWSPDSSRVIFNARRSDRLFDLYQTPANGTGQANAVLVSDGNSKFPTSWSSDGRFLLFDTTDPTNTQKGDLWVLPLNGERKPIQITATGFSELNGRFSPDNRWIAYQSNESGRDEVSVMAFVEPGRSSDSVGNASRRWPVSVGGGRQPHWSPDGKELFYIGSDGYLVSVPVTSHGSSLEFGTPQPLFDLASRPGVGAGAGGYDVSPDGRRFLINRSNDTTPTAITVVLNWTADIATR